VALYAGARVGLKHPSDSWGIHCVKSGAVELLPFQHTCSTDAPRVGNSRYLQDPHLLLGTKTHNLFNFSAVFSALRNGCQSLRKALCVCTSPTQGCVLRCIRQHSTRMYSHN
jgi:hypothetical protein